MRRACAHGPLARGFWGAGARSCERRIDSNGAGQEGRHEKEWMDGGARLKRPCRFDAIRRDHAERGFHGRVATLVFPPIGRNGNPWIWESCPASSALRLSPPGATRRSHVARSGLEYPAVMGWRRHKPLPAALNGGFSYLIRYRSRIDDRSAFRRASSSGIPNNRNRAISPSKDS